MRPDVLALDVNETLSDLAGLGHRLDEVGAPAGVLSTWFAATLRDGFGLTAAGGYADFAQVAGEALRPILAGACGLGTELDRAVDRVISGFGELPLHDDVAPGLQRAHRAGVRLVSLSNGSLATSRRLLERGGVAGLLERCLSAEQVGRWKPAPEPYRFAAEQCGVPPGQVMLAAVHPWDIDGAKRAGLAAAWINRDGSPYPRQLLAPDLTCRDFGELAEAIVS